MILVDTSAWVEFDRATGSSADARVAELIHTDAAMAVTEPVIMEVVAGARTDRREHDLRRLLGRCNLLTFDPIADFDGAVSMYRTCRQRGVTPRGLIDCMIVAVAKRRGASILAYDRDFARLANVVEADLDVAALRSP